MAAPTASPEPKIAAKPVSRFATLTKLQKLAGLLVMLGPETAAHLLKTFPLHDVDAISTEMAKLEIVSHELQQHILEEFSAVAVDAGTAVRGGVDFTRATLEKALGQYKANDVINRVATARAPLPAMHSIAEMEARQLHNLVAHEQPQTIALVLSYLSPEKAAEVSALF